VSLKKKIDPHHFNRRKQIVETKDKEHDSVMNGYIHMALHKAEEIFFNAIVKKQPLTRKLFLKQFTDNEPVHVKNFNHFLHHEIKALKQLVSAGTYKHYLVLERELNRFNTRIDFDQWTTDLLREFEMFLRRENRQINTIHNYHKKLKKFIRLAISKKLMKTNPYDGFKVRRQRTTRGFLDADQVRQLLKLYDSKKLPPHLQSTLRHFLFLCGTGMRYQDFYDLTWNNVQQDVLVYTPTKTRSSLRIVEIPLSTMAKRMIDDEDMASSSIFMANEPERVFQVKSNQKFNKQLKDINNYFNWPLNLTVHIARHTFATLWLEATGDLMSLKDLLGHSKIETTAIYTHSRRAHKMKGIKVFDQYSEQKERPTD